MRRKEPLIPIGSPFYEVLEYAWITAGAFIMAASFNLFLNPYGIASGGVVGLSTIIEAKSGLEPAFVQWVINGFLFLAGMMRLGKKFAFKTLYGSLLLPLFVFLTSGWEPLTEDAMLASLYGGIGTGIGLGLVFRGRGSTGGFALAAQMLHQWTGIRLGLTIAMLDGLVIVAAGFVFTPEKALLALLALFLTSKTIDVVQQGFSYSKVAFIITDHAETISRLILTDLDRGLTKVNVVGGYTGNARTLLMVVVHQTEVSKLKTLVRKGDPRAFFILSDTTEVLGEGFKLHMG